MLDVVTFGSATQDIFIRIKNTQVVKSKKFVTGQGICFSLGSKIRIEDIFFATGGGGTNTAATFAFQGLKTAYCGKIGDDASGQAIVKELKKLRIISDFIVRDKSHKTACSVILSLPGIERTILVYHGACHWYQESEVPWQNLKTKWIYIAGLSGKSAELFEPILNFAARNKIKVALNPGRSQINLGLEKLKSSLKKIDILILNQEEASILTGLSYQKEKEIFKILDMCVEGIVVMTKGPKGVVVSDGRYLYQAGIPKSDIIDRTGAGDAFGSGFVSGIIQKADIPFAIQLGTANATSSIQKLGAKNGLLKKGKWGKWPRVRVSKLLIS